MKHKLVPIYSEHINFLHIVARYKEDEEGYLVKISGLKLIETPTGGIKQIQSKKGGYLYKCKESDANAKKALDEFEKHKKRTEELFGIIINKRDL